ncbi:hypothetical protein GCM10011369_05740 [Neiella marina]|uniref:Sulfotransferase n=1 Tax=Neiella marina TaxID=508461 RepID=A0A8J2XMU3_9GAMM|nr:sulfotransferase [Neiella marina]GGA66954.1 hypothetical protein GCM10011369_05740 [Neiella marina]
MKRLFIVGCSRSGTTVVQSSFARSPEIKTFPETGFLLKALGMREIPNIFSLFGLSSRKEWKSLNKLEERLGLPISPTPSAFKVSSTLSLISEKLDSIAISAGCSAWLEKTPRHYYHAHKIPLYIENSHIIHVVREGADVVASIVDRANKYPDNFPRQANCQYAIKQWNKAISTQYKLIEKPRHSFVLFEDFISYPEKELRRLCNETGLNFYSNMLNNETGNTAHVLSTETWKNETPKGIFRPENKFSKLFSMAQRRQIIKHLESDKYIAIKEHLT